MAALGVPEHLGALAPELGEPRAQLQARDLVDHVRVNFAHRSPPR